MNNALKVNKAIGINRLGKMSEDEFHHNVMRFKGLSRNFATLAIQKSDLPQDRNK